MALVSHAINTHSRVSKIFSLRLSLLNSVIHLFFLYNYSSSKDYYMLDRLSDSIDKALYIHVFPNILAYVVNNSTDTDLAYIQTIIFYISHW